MNRAGKDRLVAFVMEKGMIEEKKVERVVREGRPQQLPMMKEIVFWGC